MHVYGSYFSDYRKALPEDTLMLSIARTQPKSFRFKSFDKLFPPVKLLWDYKDGKIDWDTFAETYTKDVLGNLEPSEIYKELEELAGDNKWVCLTCWEKSDDHCHRRLVLEWLNEYLADVEYKKYYE